MTFRSRCASWLYSNPQRFVPVVQAFGAVFAALILGFGALRVADLFQPRFVRWGNHVANIDQVIFIGQQDDGTGCSVILTTSVVRLYDTPDGPRTGLSGHSVDDDFDCERLRAALRDYTLDATQLADDR